MSIGRPRRDGQREECAIDHKDPKKSEIEEDYFIDGIWLINVT